jgi:hypothetical protein
VVFYPAICGKTKEITDKFDPIMQKYLQIARGFSPILFIVLYIYLSNKIPGFDYFELGVLAVLLIVGVAAYYNTVRILRNVAAGVDLPKVLADFPIHSSSEETYRQIRQKMETFILAVEAGESVQVQLSADELNCLSTKGKTLDRSAWSLPEYYEIKDGQVYASDITIAPFISRSGYYSFKSRIEIERRDKRFCEIGKVIERNGKSVSPKKRPWTFETKLLGSILVLDKTKDWNESAGLVLSRLQSVEIIDYQLILRS